MPTVSLATAPFVRWSRGTPCLNTRCARERLPCAIHRPQHLTPQHLRPSLPTRREGGNRHLNGPAKPREGLPHGAVLQALAGLVCVFGHHAYLYGLHAIVAKFLKREVYLRNFCKGLVLAY